MNNKVVVSLGKLVGKGYKRFWTFKGRYLVVKGGRGSKKSKTTALRWIKLIMQHPQGNLLVVRQVFKDHKDSTFADLQWATYQLKVNHLWKFTVSPLEITYKPTGQKIMFRGLDNPMSITSITVSKGYLCWCWFEEAYQIRSEDDFNKVDMSIRGDTKGLFKQIVLSFNPWNEKHWLKKRFFDVEDENVLALTTNYMCNEFLDSSDIKLFEWMKKNQPRRYKIEGLGEWGISEGAIFDNWKELAFDVSEIKKRSGIKSAFGLDFGYTNDPSTLSCSLVDMTNKEIYIFDEMYERGLDNEEISEKVIQMGYGKERIIADSSEPKSIAELKKYGLSRVKPAEKGKDSILNGIQFIQQFKIYIHPSCSNALIEFANYVWDKDKKTGETINKPIDDFNHFIDALRYSLEQLRKGSSVSILK